MHIDTAISHLANWTSLCQLSYYNVFYRTQNM